MRSSCAYDHCSIYRGTQMGVKRLKCQAKADHKSANMQHRGNAYSIVDLQSSSSHVQVDSPC